MKIRKLVILLLITAMLFSLTACGKKKDDDPNSGMDLEPIPSTPAHSGNPPRRTAFPRPPRRRLISPRKT